MNFLQRLKSGIQIVVGGVSQGRQIVKGVTANSGQTRPKQGEDWLSAYNTMPWLRANVSKIANGVASLEWGITRTMDLNGMTVKMPKVQKATASYRRKALAALEEEGKAEAVFDHPFLTLWKNPCPALPGGAARKLAQVYYEIVGEVFFVVDRGPRDGWIKGYSGRPLPTALWPVPPQWVKRVPTPDNPTFEIRHLGLQMQDIPITEVLWLKDPDPVNPYGRGVGMFYSLNDELDADENAARMIGYSFYNRNRPDVLVSVPNASDIELQAFRNEWASNLQGVANTLKSHFVNVEAEVQQIGFDFREMQVMELRNNLRDTIRQVPGMPPEMLGIQDQSNRSTIEAAEFIFNKHLVEPRAEVWREFLETQLLCEYDDRAILDYVSPVTEDKEFTLKVITNAPEVVRVNEKRKMAGLPALSEAEGGKMFFVNGAFVPSLMAAPPPAGMPGGPPGAPGSGSGLSHPGFEGGINVPGAPQMHLSVPGAAGSPESGIPANGAQPAPGGAPAPGAPPPPPFRLDFPGQPKGLEGLAEVVTKGAEALAAGRLTSALAGRSAPPTTAQRIAKANLPPDAAEALGRWVAAGDRGAALPDLLKTAPLPVTDDREVEFVRRSLARLQGRTTKGWNRLFGPWGEDDDELFERFLTGKGWDDDGDISKGDAPGHEFRGNQYTNGGGNGDAKADGGAGDGGKRDVGSAGAGPKDAYPEGSRGQNLAGLPATVKVGDQHIAFGGFKPAQDIAAKYAASAGIDYNPPTDYVKVDPERAERIAQEFERMRHEPDNPAVKAAYRAMIDETADQYKAILKSGLKVEFIKGDDPYGNPRNAVLDVIKNNHLYVFSTKDGFGSSAFDPKDNPLLEDTKFKDANGTPMLANDVFRVVHDYFGHIKEGVGFRADGEENAWRSHSAMYSKQARRAMTTETRGQNSWVNFGPHSKANKTAKPGETVYADQKIGLLPEWVSEQGAHTKAPHIEIIVKGDVEGHEFHGNQWTDRAGAGDEPRESEGSKAEAEVAAPIRAEKTTPAGGREFDPVTTADADGDGVTDSARVGVPAEEVPPPPSVGRLPNLTPEERAVESAFADAYEADPDGTAQKYLAMVKGDPPPTFETDGAKMLYSGWRGDGMTPEARAELRSTMNVALHQTANAITKRAFVSHLDSMSDEDKKKGLLVTVGGCGAGKGYALDTLAASGYTDFNKKLYGAVWDSAGDQNATENPWLLHEASSRGIPVTYAYISSDPEAAWADPKRGVVQRALKPTDGRMVDAKVFADSYVIGARNHAAFAEGNKGKAKFVFIQNGKNIQSLDAVPKSDVDRDKGKLHDFAVRTIAEKADLAPRVKRGALVGQRIWKEGRRRKR